MTEAPTRVCIIGAGAVALVYARYLQNAGAEVSLLVKPQYGDFCRKGFQLHRFGYRGRIRDERLVISSILTRADEVAEGAFDQIWLTVASDALREPWLDELLAASGEAVVVLLQPDLDDRMLLLERVEAARLVQGLIGFLSFQSPLPRAPNLPKGIGYTLLPGAANVFDGSRADDVVAVLRKGGMSARRQSDLPGRSAERSATTVPIIAGLEAAGWSIADFTAGPWLPLSLSASREALTVVSHSLGRPPKRVPPRLAVSVALKLAPRLMPFDLEAYLEFHFTKVGPQTRLMLETWVRHARDAGLPASAMIELRDALS
jgi:2-dehydropantoate 2-reductase